MHNIQVHLAHIFYYLFTCSLPRSSEIYRKRCNLPNNLSAEMNKDVAMPDRTTTSEALDHDLTHGEKLVATLERCHRVGNTIYELLGGLRCVGQRTNT